MAQDIYIIDDKQELIDELREIFKEEIEYKFRSVSTSNIEIALKNIPALIIIDEDNVDLDIIEFCKHIRENEDNSITPIIVISSNYEKEHRISVLKQDVEYYIIKPLDKEYFYFTVRNIIELLYRNRRVSPLTGLPGNVQIQAEMKKRFLNEEKFAVVYFDLDNFKAYNDSYGFASGDEVIKFTGRLISKHIHKIENSENFVGHIGGDDFVSIIGITDYEKICQEFILEFDAKSGGFYSDEDAERGYVEVANRKGIIEQFPLITISLAVLEIDAHIFSSILEIGEIAAQLKHKAKTVMGSSYIVNRRKF